MNTVNALMTTPLAISLFAGASVVAASDAAPNIAAVFQPVTGIAMLGLLLLSGMLLVVREVREEARDRQDRSKL